MAREIEVRIPGSVTVSDTYGGGSTVPPVVVGAAPQWSDDSDGTYAELETFEHPSVSYADVAGGLLARGIEVTTDSSQVSVVARIRYQCLNADMNVPTAYVESSITTGKLLASPYAETPGSMTPTWIDIPMPQAQAGRMGTFLNRVNDNVGTLRLWVQAGYLRKYSFRYPRTRIFEAYLVILTPGRDAPPCRIFPRDDGLGVGAGRQYPSPRSQQRGRWVGYY